MCLWSVSVLRVVVVSAVLVGVLGCGLLFFSCCGRYPLLRCDWVSVGCSSGRPAGSADIWDLEFLFGGVLGVLAVGRYLGAWDRKSVVLGEEGRSGWWPEH